jgi:acyl-CoA thioesterase
MASVRQVIEALKPTDDGWRGTIPDNWLQGRTAFGGVSTALALHAAQRLDDHLPPLRSAQVTFVGPLAGTVLIRATCLRRGRNAVFIQADVEGEAGLGLRATFVFMRDLPSRVDHAVATSPAFPAPRPETRVFTGIKGVAFTQNFEFLDCRDDRVGPAEWLRWVRLIDRAGLDPAVELAVIADSLPPAALKLVGSPAPVSSMTWLLNLLTPAPRTDDGWWLLSAATDHARAGSSSQRMAIWNTDGVSIAEQMQSVAMFA